MSKPTEHPVLALERAALTRWCKGDPSGFLEISANDVVYFDPFQPKRINGLAALTAFYETLRGKVFANQFEIIDPCIQTIGDAAVLTFNFVSHAVPGDAPMRWNCTEVYQRTDAGWKIIQTHWSFTQAVSQE